VKGDLGSGALRLALAIALLAAAVRAPASDFYAYYTKLDYTQPATPDWLGGIPVSAANVFSGGRPDPADAGYGGSALGDPPQGVGFGRYPDREVLPPEVLGGQESRQRC